MESHRERGGLGTGVSLLLFLIFLPLGVAQRGGGRTSARFETFQIYLGWRKFNLKWRLRYNGSLRYSATRPHPSPPQLISTLPPPPFPTYFSFIHTAPCVRVSPSFEIQNAVAGAGAFKENSVAWDIIDKRETGRSFNIIRQIVDLCATNFYDRKELKQMFIFALLNISNNLIFVFVVFIIEILM